MDPYTALSLAGTVVQFVDFSLSIVGTMVQLGRTGTSAELQQFEKHVQELRSAMEDMRRHHPDKSAPDELQRAHRSMLEVVSSCSACADQLLEYISNLKPGIKRSKLRDLISATKITFNKEKLSEMSNQLNSCRQQLTLQLLSYINVQQTCSTTKLSSEIREQSSKIIEAMSFIRAPTESQHVSGNLDRELREARRAVHCILEYEDGRITVMDPQSSIIATSQSADSSKSQWISFGSRDFERSNNIGNGPLYNWILEGLYFDMIRFRAEEIEPAHVRTFEWIYDESLSDGRPSTSYAKWLRSGSGVFWVEGKAGSGKSTLLKFMSQEKRQLEILKSWAGASKLITASYYSWNLGTSLQKSLTGLLRSLLFDILKEARELIPLVLPEYFSRCQHSLSNRNSPPEPEYSSLRNAFRNLTKQRILDIKCCILIDGIDEFDGDHNDICDILSQITSERLKIIVSSRPIPVCVSAFGDCKRIRLQDLTANDMRIYAEELLSTHKHFDRLLQQDELQTMDLIGQLVVRAEGVFLWTTLAATSIRNGMDNFDSLTELFSRLDELPSGLHDLYAHLLSKLEPRYRHEAAEILQTVLFGVRTLRGSPLTTLQLSLFQESRDKPLSSWSYNISDEEALTRHRIMEGRLRSRCWGLVEVRVDPDATGLELVLESRILFLHRTVAEFLDTPDVQEDLFKPSARSDFDPIVSAAYAILCQVKTNFRLQSREFNMASRLTAIWSCIQHCIHGCLEGNMESWHKFLDGMAECVNADSTLRCELTQLSLIIIEVSPTSKANLSHAIQMDGYAFVLFMACSFGISSYVHEVCTRKERGSTSVNLQDILHLTLVTAPREGSPNSENIVRAVEELASTLSRTGYGLDASVDTLWTTFYQDVPYISDTHVRRPPSTNKSFFLDLLQVLISHGAKSNYSALGIPAHPCTFVTYSSYLAFISAAEGDRQQSKSIFQDRKNPSIEAKTIALLENSRVSGHWSPQRRFRSMSAPRPPSQWPGQEATQWKWDIVPYYGGNSDDDENPTSYSYGLACPL